MFIISFEYNDADAVDVDVDVVVDVKFADFVRLH